MKITDLDYYVKFIFSDGEDMCLSTTDREMLNHVKSNNTGKTPTGYKVGDILQFSPDETPYEIKDIKIRGLIEDTELNKYGFDKEDCTQVQGEKKDFIFSINIRIEQVQK